MVQHESSSTPNQKRPNWFLRHPVAKIAFAGITVVTVNGLVQNGLTQQKLHRTETGIEGNILAKNGKSGTFLTSGRKPKKVSVIDVELPKSYKELPDIHTFLQGDSTPIPASDVAVIKLPKNINSKDNEHQETKFVGYSDGLFLKSPVYSNNEVPGIQYYLGSTNSSNVGLRVSTSTDLPDTEFKIESNFDADDNNYNVYLDVFSGEKSIPDNTYVYLSTGGDSISSPNQY